SQKSFSLPAHHLKNREKHVVSRPSDTTCFSFWGGAYRYSARLLRSPASQAKLFDNDRHYWYTCPSKSGLMTPPVPRGSRELTPVEAKVRANLNGNQGGQSPRKQEPTFVRTGNPVSVYGTGGCQIIAQLQFCGNMG